MYYDCEWNLHRIIILVSLNVQQYMIYDIGKRFPNCAQTCIYYIGWKLTLKFSSEISLIISIVLPPRRPAVSKAPPVNTKELKP